MMMGPAVNCDPTYQTHYAMVAMGTDELSDSNCMKNLRAVAFAHNDSLDADFQN